jgi:hypothetical protein
MHPRQMMELAKQLEIERRRECQQRQLISQMIADKRRGADWARLLSLLAKTVRRVPAFQLPLDRPDHRAGA